MAGHSGQSGERIIVLGRIGGAFGVSGWVKIQSYTDPPGNLLKYPGWLLKTAPKQEWTATRCLQGREVSRAVQAQLEGVITRDQAAELRGAEIGVRRSELPELAPGEYYWEDLLGLDVYSMEGESLGQVQEILATPAHPLLRIAAADKGRKADEVLVPLVRERVKAVDLSERKIKVDWRRDWLSGD